MQNNSNKLDMPGGFKENIANDTSFSSSHAHGTSATNNPDSTPIATTMRSANVVNPHGSAYEVAGPTTGGTSLLHNRALDAVKGQSLNDSAGAPSGTPAHGLTETVKESAAAAVAAAATGATAAGASVIAAAKKLISSGDDHENDLGDYSQHESNFHPISNINTTTASTAADNTISLDSPNVSSPRTPSVTSTSSPKPLGPNDRPPIKVAIHAHKPSDKATYGNLDSPGAQNHPGPLSDRALAGTPPPSSTPKKTIADPFGPVMVANWNDHKRQADVSTPTSEDFDNPHIETSTRSSTAPSVQPAAAAAAAASKRMHAPSPLRVSTLMFVSFQHYHIYLLYTPISKENFLTINSLTARPLFRRRTHQSRRPMQFLSHSHRQATSLTSSTAQPWTMQLLTTHQPSPPPSLITNTRNP